LASHRIQCEQIRRITSAVQAAGGKTGELSFSLSWQSGEYKTDLDMIVTHPCGAAISCNRKQCLQCSAQLDVDDRGSNGTLSCENVYWSESAPEGNYSVTVQLHRGPKVPFQVVAKVGNEPRLFSHPASVFGTGKNQVACSFELGPNGPRFEGDAGRLSTAGMFRRTARSAILARRLGLGKAKGDEESWDCFTDSSGWCRLGDTVEAVRLGPMSEACSHVPVDILCRDFPVEVIYPMARRPKAAGASISKHCPGTPCVVPLAKTMA